MSGVKLGFGLEPLMIPLVQILPSRRPPEGLLQSFKYKQIRVSISAVGMIEPLSIAATSSPSGQYVLLDGHIRMHVLRDLGITEAACLLAKDDEGYTYNNRINRISTIQEHHMLRRAVARGVSPSRLAEALAVDVRTIAKKLTLLDGICPEAAELLKDHHFTADISRVLRKMKSTRQLECVELMVSANAVTVAYAEAMLVATSEDQLEVGRKPRKLNGVTPEQMAKMEHEMSNLQGQYKMAEEAYGLDVLNLVLARGYLARMVGNTAVRRHLQIRHSELLTEFDVIVKTASLEQ